MPASRIMVVDDFKEWRRNVCSILQEQPELRIIAEAADGAEAVLKAEKLKPDLILLDIGLPKLNGIKAALRISQVSPGSKIVFLSQDNDAGVVRAALGTGASAYVHKLHAGSELLTAITAVLDGRRFVSGGESSDRTRCESIATTGT